MSAVEKRWKVRLERHGLSAGTTIVMAASRAEAKERAALRHPSCVAVSASADKA